MSDLSQEMLDALRDSEFATNFLSEALAKGPMEYLAAVAGFSQACHHELTGAELAIMSRAMSTAPPALRGRLFAALHEAGHAFVVTRLGILTLKEVSITGSMIPGEQGRDLSADWTATGDGGGYYLCEEPAQRPLSMLGDYALFSGLVKHFISGKMVWQVFESEFPLTFQDHVGATFDYIQAHTRLVLYLMSLGVTDMAALRLEVAGFVSDAENEVKDLMVKHKDNLRSLWLNLADQEVMSGEEVAAVVFRE